LDTIFDSCDKFRLAWCLSCCLTERLEPTANRETGAVDLKDKNMKISRLVGLGLLLGVFAGSNAYALPTVTVTWDPNHSPDGGEFVLHTSDIGTFNSFCLERSENVDLHGTIYYYTTSNSAILGGTDTIDAGPGDPISIATAWLYSQFAAGTLSGYTHTVAQQTDLQNAIWMLEQEIAWNSSNQYIVLAGTTLFGTTWTQAQLQAAANGAYGVSVMNLWTNPDGTGQAQDMLKVPDGGSTLALLGLAMTGLAWVSRRKQRAGRRKK
jgi:VPDSG-CTERM motif